MTSPNFQSILDTPVDTIERPRPLPVGTYLCVVAGQPRFDKSRQKQTDFVEFTLNIANPGPDVDQSALAEVGGVSGKTLRATYYLTPDALYRLKEFLDHCGVDVSKGSIRELISMAPGHQVYATVIHQATQDGSAVYANVGKTAKV